MSDAIEGHPDTAERWAGSWYEPQQPGAALAVAPRPATAGSDAHDNEKAGAFATRVADHVRTPADLAAEIRAGRVEPVRR
jgi:hypothetical protein